MQNDLDKLKIEKLNELIKTPELKLYKILFDELINKIDLKKELKNLNKPST